MYSVDELRDKLRNLGEEDVKTIRQISGYDIENILREDYRDVTHIFGLPFKFIDQYRDYSCYYWVFSLGDKTYRYAGSFDSWAGIEFYHDLTECEKKIITMDVWVDK